MFGIRYVRVPPTTYIIQYRGGQVAREGAGLSFFYRSLGTTLVAIPAGSVDVPFLFTEITSDFQEVTVQGQLTYQVIDPKKLASRLDFSLAAPGRYETDDPQKVGPRLSTAAQTATKAEIQSRPLREVLLQAEAIGRRIRENLTASPAVQTLGLEIQDVAIVGIKPNPDTARALEAEARERLLREADDATYSRRNNSVDQERKIRENELNTEVTVQAKQREIDQTRLESKIALEDRRKQLVTLEADNSRTTADAQAYLLDATLKPLAGLDPRALQVLAGHQLDPKRLVAMAFQEIAANASKVGTLNITPDLLETLMEKPSGGKR